MFCGAQNNEICAGYYCFLHYLCIIEKCLGQMFPIIRADYEICCKTIPMGNSVSDFIDIDHSNCAGDGVPEFAWHGQMGGVLSTYALGKVLVLADVCEG